ncbi:BET3 family protein [Eremomyces bilateralis CBS 781.70]|uniref:BET3 family protein n=1 Tax=Eremomyces bilateralis CBS 781.70 TaxID=1392243 RepID=A0A6G1G204_9PEZI|nr:BET3 family protein [Eremomyces bilateralis CBS 781.70]KAF1812048.1 BET3 family protein [Eremomyces bilateralis CBS 781.70]
MSFEAPTPPYNSTDPYAAYLNTSCLDLLLIELVPMAYRISAELALQEAQYHPSSKSARRASASEELREAAYLRLEGLGYRVGLGVAERFSRDRPRVTEPLDIIKFICKDVWSIIFRKQIDNLKTNHRGIFVLTDNNFKPIHRISMEKGRDGMLAQTQAFLVFPGGIIRGALAAMGITASVSAESQEIPAATFQIRTVGAKA